jgi:hypothetical protein
MTHFDTGKTVFVAGGTSDIAVARQIHPAWPSARRPAKSAVLLSVRAGQAT